MVRIEVAHLGLDRSTNTPVVVLKEHSGDRMLRIFIGAPEAAAIALEMRGESPPRPMTHDLLKHLLAALGGALRRVTITGAREASGQRRSGVDIQRHIAIRNVEKKEV